MQRNTAHTIQGLLVFTTIILITACQSGGQTGALAGGGIGALAGQAIGGNTKGTLIGAAVGTGIGYIIGNEADKKHAREMNAAALRVPSAGHSEVGSLGGTRWSVISLTPRSIVTEFTSKIIEFKRNGRIHTTTTRPDGSVEFFDETYRVVGNTLIINKPGYLINARFSISGNQLTVSAEEFSAVLSRL